MGPRQSEIREGIPAVRNSKKHQHVCTSWREISSDFWEHLVTFVLTHVWCVKASGYSKGIHSKVNTVSLLFSGLKKCVLLFFFSIVKIHAATENLENMEKYTY